MLRFFILSLLIAAPAFAKKTPVPKRQIPPSVLASLRVLQRDFGRALAQDCAPERCFAKGCVYVAHTVVDQPATRGLPGLHLQADPDGDAPSQMYLTSAECSFAHEKSVRPKYARILATRLAAKLSTGWTQVDVTYEKLKPVPAFIRESPEPPPDPPPPPPVVDAEVDAGVADVGVTEPELEAWSGPVAGRELWLSLLPHFSWMIALIMLTLATLMVIWALRRLGRASPEEQALLAQMLNDANGPSGDEPPGTELPPKTVKTPDPNVQAQFDRWQARLQGDDPALQGLVSDLLRNGERRVLAKAVMLFPDSFPRAFPQTGTLASAKYEVANLLKHVDHEALPSDEAFFETLNRYALAASLTTNADTDLIRGLHDEFGASALMTLLAAVPPRYGALLFAQVPEAMQHEAVVLLSERQRVEIAHQLLRSNRVDPSETRYLLDLLAALRAEEALPAPPARQEVSDRGTEFNATGALSVLLPRVSPEARAQLVDATAARLGGQLPSWIGGTLYGQMLLKLEPSERSDLLLSVDANALAAWLKAQTPDTQAQLTQSMPTALRAALSGARTPASPEAHYALVADARAALSAALRRRLMRGDLSFKTLLV